MKPYLNSLKWFLLLTIAPLVIISYGSYQFAKIEIKKELQGVIDQTNLDQDHLTKNITIQNLKDLFVNSMNTFAVLLIFSAIILNIGVAIYILKLIIEPQIQKLKWGSELISHSMDAIIIIDEIGQIESINSAAERLFGYSSTEVIGKNIKMMMPQPFKDEHDSYLRNYVNTGKSKVLGVLRELPAIRKNGENIFIELSANEIYYGKQRKFAGFIRDITDRKHAQELQSKLTKEIEDLYNKAPCGYHSLDKNGVFRLINDTELDWLGYSREEIVGKLRAVDLLSPESAKQFEIYFPQLVANGSNLDLEVEIIRKDGSIFTGLLNASANYDNQGNFISSRSTIIDISKRKEFEKDKLHAQESNRAKSEFIANMSHEIRTPMNIISGMAQVLLESPLSEDQKKYVSMFDKASNTLLNIINDILDISKIESGSLTIEKTEINVKNLIADIAELCRSKADAKNLNFSYVVSRNIPENILSDDLRIRQTLMNLIGNAIKFTNTGSVSIEVEINSIETRKGNLLFKVSDTGIGISAEQEQILFKPFSQANSSITKNYGGTGLGLVICKKLVELMGGEIWFTSQLGKGTTFYFTLTCEFLHKPKSPIQRITEEKLGNLHINAEQSPQRSGNLLLVDDSAENRNLIKVFLKNTNYKITEAENGEIAVARVKKDKFDIILMDMQMPILDGYSATQQIRDWEKQSHNAKTPIVALTAYALLEEQQKSLSVGCDIHLTKPIKKAELIRIVDSFIANSVSHT